MKSDKTELYLLNKGIKELRACANSPGVNAGWNIDSYCIREFEELEERGSVLYKYFYKICEEIYDDYFASLGRFCDKMLISLQIFELILFADDVRNLLKGNPKLLKKLEDDPTGHLIDNLPKQSNINMLFEYLYQCYEELFNLYRYKSKLLAFKKRSGSVQVLKMMYDIGLSDSSIKWKRHNYLEACKIFRNNQDFEDQAEFANVCCLELDKRNSPIQIEPFDFEKLKPKKDVIAKMALDPTNDGPYTDAVLGSFKELTNIHDRFISDLCRSTALY